MRKGSLPNERPWTAGSGPRIDFANCLIMAVVFLSATITLSVLLIAVSLFINAIGGW